MLHDGMRTPSRKFWRGLVIRRISHKSLNEDMTRAHGATPCVTPRLMGRQKPLAPDESTKPRPVTAWFLFVFCGLVSVHILLMICVRLYPFVDLPHHLATAAIWRHYGDVGNDLATYYRVVPFPRPNILHPLLCSLPVFPTVEFANKVALTLYVVSVPALTLLIIRKLHGNPWFALLSLLFVYNLNVSWGFVGFTLAIPLALTLVYLLVAFDRQDAPGRDVAVTGILIALFFTHLLVGIFCVLLYGVWCFHTQRTPGRRLLRRLLPVVPFVALTAVFWLTYEHGNHRSTPGFLASYYRHQYLGSVFARKQLVWIDNSHWLPGTRGKLVGCFFSAAALLPVFLGLRVNRRAVRRTSAEDRVKLTALFLLAGVLCYALLPNRLPGQWLLYRRFSCFVWLFFIVLGSTLVARTSRKVTGFLALWIATVCLLHASLSVDYFVQFNKDTRKFTEEVLPREAEEKVLAGLVYDYEFRGRPVYIHFPNYNTVWRGGVTVSSIVDYRFGTVRRRVGRKILPPDNEWVGRNRNYQGQFARVDYILVRGGLPQERKRYFQQFRLLKKEGSWQLYGNQRTGTRKCPSCNGTGRRSAPR